MDWRYWIAAAGVALVPASALADAIDGNWCSPRGRHLTIEGPRIVTPAGRALQGDYDRHAFSYVVPDGEPDAGGRVYMILRNEMTVELRAGAPDAPAEVWRRCEFTS